MEKQLNISDIRKPSHAEKIEGDPVPGDRHCWTFIPGLQKLASDDLIALQIKGGKRAFPHPGFPIWPLDAVVCIVVKSGIVVDPVVVDGNESTENSAVYDLKAGQSAADMVLSVLKKRLHHLKRLPRDDGLMLVQIVVLVQVLPVLSALVLKQIRGKGFPGQNVAAVPLICENVADGAAVPVRAPGFCPAADIRQKICDIRLGPAVEICVENKADHFGLCFVDHKGRVFDIVSGGVPLPVIAQRRGRQQLAVLKPLGQRPDHGFPLFNGFLLGNGGEKGQHQFRVFPQRVQVIHLKKHIHRRGEILKLANQGNTVHQISRKAGNAFCHDQVVFTLLAGGDPGKCVQRRLADTTFVGGNGTSVHSQQTRQLLL